MALQFTLTSWSLACLLAQLVSGFRASADHSYDAPTDGDERKER